MLNPSQKRFAEIVTQIINCNPFLPERIQLERELLGSDFVEPNANWNLHPSEHFQTVNLQLMHDKAEAILAAVDFATLPRNELTMMLDLLWLVVFGELKQPLETLWEDKGKSASTVYEQFETRWFQLIPKAETPKSVIAQMPHIFAMLFQIRRAFNNTFQHIIGSSPPVIEMRANVWRSLFTHDVRRYVKTMHATMSDFPTLITGPTGSGKELVARAIGLSGFVPYDPAKGKFTSPLDQLFTSLNLSALSPTLIESELFGHTKGAFTGATSDRIGWLEACPEYGAVFLDEIGELDHDIQVKLLRVAQDRVFQRLGDTEPRRFRGRIIAATNRDLATEIQAGRFRMDFYYRLCADQVQTPSLAERYETDPTEMRHLVEHLLARIVGAEEKQLSREFLTWVQEKLGSDYQWPGNVRELDQCIRSWLIRKDYQPCKVIPEPAEENESDLPTLLANSELTAEQLVALYCKTKYEQTGSYVKTAQHLGLDRRTVKAKVDS